MSNGAFELHEAFLRIIFGLFLFLNVAIKPSLIENLEG